MRIWLRSQKPYFDLTFQGRQEDLTDDLLFKIVGLAVPGLSRQVVSALWRGVRSLISALESEGYSDINVSLEVSSVEQ